MSLTSPVAKIHVVQDEERRTRWRKFLGNDVDGLPGGGKIKLSKMKNKTRCAVNQVVHDVDVLPGGDNASQGSEKAKATQNVDVDVNEFPDGDNPSCTRCR